MRETPPGLRSPHRISPPVARHPYIARFSSHGLEGVKGKYACYAPLTGVGCTGVEPLGDKPCPNLVALSGSEVVSLEDKDIARDYLAQLHGVPERIAALALSIEADGTDERSALRGLRRMREIAVASLRLAGFDEFIDPELAGLHVLYEQRPLREPSVLRQTVLTRLKREPAYVFGDADRPRRTSAWALLFRYQGSARHPDIEGWLSAFRRLHDGEFLPPLARANLGVALVEGLLGRFRPPGDPQPLEALVARVAAGSNDLPAVAGSAWFSTEARAWRNALAHGRLREIDEAPISHLLAIARAAIPRAITLWLDGGDPKRRPAKLLIRELAGAGVG